MRHIAVCAALASLVAGVEAVEITKDWVIALPGDGAPAVRHAMKVVAEELRRDIAEARGFSLPIVGESAARSPVVRRGDRARSQVRGLRV